MHKALIGVLIILAAAFIVYIVMVMVYALQGCNDKCSHWSKEASLAYLHSTLKGVYALTLKRNVHKAKHIQKVMDDLELKGKLWYGHDAKTQGVDGMCPNGTKRSDGELGCTTSHLAIWKDILKHNPQPNDWFIIFEDDAKPEGTKEEVLSKMADGLKRSNEEGYRLIYFGYMSNAIDPFWGKRLDKHRWQLKCGGTHAYAVQASLIENLIETVEAHMCSTPVDLIMARRLKEPGVTVAMDAYKPFHFFKQFLNEPRGIFGQIRNDEFSSDIRS